jgi:two-component system, NtrC family, sensor histidine kinase HydH
VNREIMRNVDRIEQLVRTLLSYAADPSDRQSSADISAELRSTAQRFAPDLRASGKQFLLDIAADLGTADADPVVLAQVFDSLMANAVEATRPGDLVRVSARRDGDSARIDFADNGAGIDAGQLQDIFKPFFTTKPRGLGLGLPLARRLMKRLGGSLDIESQAGNGTRVRLQFPVHLGTP